MGCTIERPPVIFEKITKNMISGVLGVKWGKSPSSRTI